MTRPPRNVVPKPLQKPHPPLWVACSRRETIHLAARSGIGALSFSFAEPEQAARWVAEYYGLIGSDECVPRGLAVNANVAVVLPMMLHPDEATAIERGIDGAHFFGYALGHYYGGTHLVGGTDLWHSFGTDSSARGFAREIVSADAAPLAVRLVQAAAAGFDGTIVFDLGASDGTRRCWTIEVSRGHARARAGRAPDAALTIRLAIPDFIRVTAGAGSFTELIADGRVLIDGDLALAGRMGEMFGARPVY